jgi:phage terminase small subunit
MARTLTPKQAAFVREYQVDMNATQAAIRAGYSEATAYAQGSRLLKHVEVQHALAQVTETAVQTVDAHLGGAVLTAERVLTEYARIAFADMRRFATVKGGSVRLTDSDQWTDDDAAAVSELGETVTENGGSIRFKLHSKVSALDALAKHLGLLGEERSSGDMAQRLAALAIMSTMTPEQLRAAAGAARG